MQDAPSVPPGGPDMRQAVAAIEAMAWKLRQRFGAGLPEPGLTPEPSPAAEPGWWVVLCGEALDPRDFDQRERARRRLADKARLLGLAGNECVWVWDDTDTAQVVVFHTPDYQLAQGESERLRALGLRVRVIREFA